MNIESVWNSVEISVKKRLESKFEELAERVIVLALETAEYDEDRAEQFLQSTLAEEKSTATEATPIERFVKLVLKAFPFFAENKKK